MESAQPMTAEGEVTTPKMEKLQRLDELIRDLENKPEDQAGLLIIATVLAIRRVCASRGIFDRGRRMRVVKSAVADFERKLRTFSWNPTV